MNPASQTLRAALLIPLFVACAETEVAAPPPIRAVKVITLDEANRPATRLVSGRLHPGKRSQLSFGVAGTVEEIWVSAGDRVAEAQPLARLDRAPFEDRLRVTRARLSAARRKLQEARSELDRREKLLAQGFASKTEVDSARVSLQVAESEASGAEADVETATRDLDRTQLTAPFSGVIASREIDAFAEVSGSQAIFGLQGENNLELQVLVPAQVLRFVHHGDSIGIEIPELDHAELRGSVVEVAAEAAEGGSFRVAIAFEPGELPARPGMTATATFELASGKGATGGFAIPLSAVATRESTMGDGPGSTIPIYVFDPAKSQVVLRRVEADAPRGDDIVVHGGGLEAGDQVVVAGVAFLHDGMPATVWAPPE